MLRITSRPRVSGLAGSVLPEPSRTIRLQMAGLRTGVLKSSCSKPSNQPDGGRQLPPFSHMLKSLFLPYWEAEKFRAIHGYEILILAQAAVAILLWFLHPGQDIPSLPQVLAAWNN